MKYLYDIVCKYDIFVYVHVYDKENKNPFLLVLLCIKVSIPHTVIPLGQFGMR